MADKPSLDDVKKRLSNNFLGRGGIHAIGLSGEAESIQIYLNPDADEKSPLMDELKAAAQPYATIVIRADQAFAH